MKRFSLISDPVPTLTGEDMSRLADRMLDGLWQRGFRRFRCPQARRLAGGALQRKCGHVRVFAAFDLRLLRWQLRADVWASRR